MQDYKKLNVWEKAHRMTLEIYRITRCFPREELYGLTSQLRRAATSVPTNIVEGCGRNSDADFARFLDVAFGSANEVDYLLLLSQDLGFMNKTEHEEVTYDVNEIKRMLGALCRTLRAKCAKPRQEKRAVS